MRAPSQPVRHPKLLKTPTGHSPPNLTQPDRPQLPDATQSKRTHMEPNPLRNHIKSSTRWTELDQKQLNPPTPTPTCLHPNPSQPIHIQPLPPSPAAHDRTHRNPSPPQCGPTLGRRGYVSRGLGERLESSPQTGSRANQNVHLIHTGSRKNLQEECTGFIQDAFTRALSRQPRIRTTYVVA